MAKYCVLILNNFAPAVLLNILEFKTKSEQAVFIVVSKSKSNLIPISLFCIEFLFVLFQIKVVPLSCTNLDFKYYYDWKCRTDLFNYFSFNNRNFMYILKVFLISCVWRYVSE